MQGTRISPTMLTTDSGDVGKLVVFFHSRVQCTSSCYELDQFMSTKSKKDSQSGTKKDFNLLQNRERILTHPDKNFQQLQRLQIFQHMSFQQDKIYFSSQFSQRTNMSQY